MKLQMNLVIAVVLCILACFAAATASSITNTYYNITDILGRSRTFDGIGALSGGGATSVLLWTYPEPYRSEILDYLFLPNFGASLHMLKVEIGAGEQSTDGTEPSHMNSPFEENYERGYEWWLLTEAKKRNPQIKTYGLAWGFPAWVSCDIISSKNNSNNNNQTLKNCTYDPYSHPHQTATYITKWIVGARTHYGIEIDYVGIWNERKWNTTYIEILRATLDSAGCSYTKIVAPDNIQGKGWAIADEILNSSFLAKSIYAIGDHYPGTMSTPQAQQTRMPLWASEDDSTYNNHVGAGCWGRIINQNFVNGNMSASINWNLIASYQKGTNWYRAGLTTALSPWSGSYGVFSTAPRRNNDKKSRSFSSPPSSSSSSSSISSTSWSMGGMFWATAHTSQFSSPDGNWAYLHVDANQGGSGHLKLGGSYITLKNFQTDEFTIVVEKFDPLFSTCVRPDLDSYLAEDETVTFKISPSLLQNGKIQALHVWKTHFAYYPNNSTTSNENDDETTEFEYQGLLPIDKSTNEFTIDMKVNSIFTLTTVPTGQKGAHRSSTNPPPRPSLFPTKYEDDFNSCRISGEAKYFSDQSGSFVCVKSTNESNNHNNIVMQQIVPLPPIGWTSVTAPHTLIGHRDMVNQSLSIDAKIVRSGESFVFGTRCQKQNNVLCNIFVIEANDNNNNNNNSSNSNSSTFYIFDNLRMNKTTDIKYQGQLPPALKRIQSNVWHTYRMDINGTLLNIWIDGEYHIVENLDVSSWGTGSGWGMIGTRKFAEYTQFDNLKLHSSYYRNRFDGDENNHENYNQKTTTAIFKQGDPICNAECVTEVGVQASSQWNFLAAPVNSKNLNTNKKTSALIQLKANTELCVRATPNNNSSWHLHRNNKKQKPLSSLSSSASSLHKNKALKSDGEKQMQLLHLATCNTSDPYQMWSWFFEGISPDGEQKSFFFFEEPFGTILCLNVSDTDIGLPMDAAPCDIWNLNQLFFYDYDVGQISNEATVTCMGVC